MITVACSNVLLSALEARCPSVKCWNFKHTTWREHDANGIGRKEASLKVGGFDMAKSKSDGEGLKMLWNYRYWQRY